MSLSQEFLPKATASSRIGFSVLAKIYYCGPPIVPANLMKTFSRNIKWIFLVNVRIGQIDFFILSLSYLTMARASLVSFFS